MNYNFDGVDAASDMSMTYPGTIDVFAIGEVTFGNSTNKGTRYMELEFANKNSSFKHQFYLTQKALKRIQYLHEKVHNGAKLTGDINEEQLTLKFKDKKVGLKVTGRVSTNGKGYPDLSYSGFAAIPSEVDFLSFTGQEESDIEAAKAAIEASRNENADSESATAGASSAAEDENF